MSVAFSPDGMTLASAYWDNHNRSFFPAGEVKLWDVAPGQ
jgi:hypothetical protein